jgi:hypothetical protein
MVNANLPTELPGKFFVVEYNEYTETFTVVIDDGQMSSYRLGEVLQAHARLKLWGVDTLLAGRALDYAREFKAPVQCIPSENRTISLRDRTQKSPLKFEEDTNTTWLHNV